MRFLELQMSEKKIYRAKSAVETEIIKSWIHGPKQNKKMFDENKSGVAI